MHFLDEEDERGIVMNIPPSPNDFDLAELHRCRGRGRSVKREPSELSTFLLTWLFAASFMGLGFLVGYGFAVLSK